MEILRHPLYSILAVIAIGAASGAAAHWLGGRSGKLTTLIFAGIGAAFLGFHFAMLSNLATDILLMPFGVAVVGALLVSFALAGTWFGCKSKPAPR